MDRSFLVTFGIFSFFLNVQVRQVKGAESCLLW
ncbi:rCG20810 [Rattus norvegicus]|uniref:RCG20810 n=1 Tax=Rattus norvegicus TaxID=10116 RepID=A6JDZ2_RAT|nr:rCG20810 [Rattus norvegicus]